MAAQFAFTLLPSMVLLPQCWEMATPLYEQLWTLYAVRVQLYGQDTDTTSQLIKLGKDEGQVSRPRSKTGLCVGVSVGGWSEVRKEGDEGH